MRNCPRVEPPKPCDTLRAVSRRRDPIDRVEPPKPCEKLLLSRGPRRRADPNLLGSNRQSRVTSSCLTRPAAARRPQSARVEPPKPCDTLLLSRGGGGATPMSPSNRQSRVTRSCCHAARGGAPTPICSGRTAKAV